MHSGLKPPSFLARLRRPAMLFVLVAISVLSAGLADSFSPRALAAQNQPAAGNLAEVLRGMEKRYNGLKTIRLRFEQIYRQGRQVVRRESGTLHLLKPGKMRWQYEEPEPKLFLADGRNLTLYVPSENRATQMSMKEADDLRTPFAFLLGRLRFDEEFDRLEPSPDFPPLESGNIVIRAVPKRLPERVEWIVFEVTPSLEIRRLIFEEPGGIQTEFRFSEEEANPKLAMQLFYFQAPPGTQLIREQ
jgi:outer membrane lipoprotein carrier protein